MDARREGGIPWESKRSLVSLPTRPLQPSAEADARPQDMAAIVREAPMAQASIDALHDIAQQMLKSTGADLLALALRRIFDVVGAAQRVTVVAWPPAADGKFEPLLPEDVLRRGGIPPSPVSASMARHAVEARRALYFLGTSSEHEDLRKAPSVLANRIQSAVYVPLIAEGDNVLGLLCVDTPRPTSPLVPADFHFIRAVGALLSAALAAERIRDDAHRQELVAREEEVRRNAMTNCLRIASHDLRNPLVVVHLAAHSLATSSNENTRTVMHDAIQNAVTRATRLIDTYLEASEAVAGRPLVARKATVDPRAMVDEEIAFLRAAYRDEALPVENEVACRSLLADPEKLRQIFANLLSNAQKYSPDGGRIRVFSRESAEGVIFGVSDSGVGIKPQDQQSLFGPFQRVGDVTATKGTGLGLWITRALVEANGGSIWVESTPGQGATFLFRIPAR